ncbi:MAG: DUF2950 domain-containing protein [Betaproteobacteria bacterium]|nr:DUF2950 domain-containing protein [Betaproteobacteria bacterium]
MAAAIAGAMLAAAGPGAFAQEKKAPAASTASKAAAQKTFATPEDAAKALADAVRAGSTDALLAVVGPKSKSWLFTGDDVADKAEWAKFLACYDKKNSIAKQGEAKAVLNCGGDDWPFPAPLAKKGDKWSFDAEAGHEEIANRRVGRNELNAIQAMLAIVDAQREYAATDADGNGTSDYAARFTSTPGKKDGLYWATKDGEKPSPLGPIAAKAVSEGYGAKTRAGKPEAFHGYYYRMLTSQGKDAPGGAFDYVVKGKMWGGFAVVAYPASYGNSGVKSFIVSHDGVVYEKDLGPSSASAAGKMKAFNPDKTWSKAQ